MTREELINLAVKVLAEEFEAEQEQLTEDALVKETLELDSLSLVDFIAVIDHTFKVKIPNDDLPKLKTFGQLYDYLEARM